MIFTDAAELSGVTPMPGGYIAVHARVSRGGNVQDYLGSEVGRPDLGRVAVYRPETTVFDKASAQTFAHKPVTLNHPAKGVTADSWSDEAVGHIGEEVMRDGEFIRVPMVISAARAIKAVKDGHRELSVGYSCDLVFEDGTAPDGTPYQAKQTNIVVDHLAIVPQGRAGPSCRVGDTKDPPMTLRTVMVDGLSIEVTDQGAQVITKLQGQLADAATEAGKIAGEHVSAIAAKDKELGTKDAEIADLKTKVVDGAALDALVADRLEVVGKAKAIAPTLDTKGKTNAEIKRAAVGAKLGDAKVKDKPDAYVDGLFDHLTADAKTADPLREAIRDSVPVTDAAKAEAEALAARSKRFATAHRQPAPAAA